MCDKCQCICFQPSIADRQLSMVQGVNISLPLIPHLLFLSVIVVVAFSISIFYSCICGNIYIDCRSKFLRNLYANNLCFITLTMISAPHLLSHINHWRHSLVCFLSCHVHILNNFENHKFYIIFKQSLFIIWFMEWQHP